ncbi:2-hydroxyacid dehydrogenase [Teichococcus oryzae]|uniref:Glyoxylate/hydroxypyruvate reductase A n=1 Tax=Teichococcus oryzae TaxID=1608942 RepID=A0A5B2TBL3_9PROT|nr:glyoxylate/hydroxypyruvate reductase A [Pseudoroseomonas oryzae]KAA2211911.1 glyoxylate/hydroxypyruvate reductase A [Pseudoroseomonas oryzae]
MKLLVKSGGRGAVAEWQECFRKADPRISVHWWEDEGVAPEAVDYALVWDPRPGWLASLPNLKMVFSSGAGVEHITRDPGWPRHLPLIRMGGPETDQRMGEYIAWACLSLLRETRHFALGQAAAEWRHKANPFAATERRVGIMGLGNLGSRAAAMLQGLGFPVRGWSRSRKNLPGVVSYAGADELAEFLAGTDILVCLLPSTPETAGLIDGRLLAKLPPGADVVNAGRGSHLVVADLLAALDSGHLGGAVLDVFEEEPLPAASPLWSHPKVIVTPHVASEASRQGRAGYVAGVIADFEAGRPLPNRYDPIRGY